MRLSTALLIILTVSFATMLDARPPKRPSRPTVRGQINKAVNLIEKEIKQLQKELKTAQDEYPKTQLDLKQAKKELQEQEKALQARLGTKVGLTDAIAAVEQAEEKYDGAVATLTNDFREDEQFQALLSECKKSRLKSSN